MPEVEDEYAVSMQQKVLRSMIEEVAFAVSTNESRPVHTGALFETAGQFAYIYAIADQEHIALSAPIISAYCAASVLWSRIFLKEKLSWKHYASIVLVVAGIVIMGILDV